MPSQVTFQEAIAGYIQMADQPIEFYRLLASKIVEKGPVAAADELATHIAGHHKTFAALMVLVYPDLLGADEDAISEAKRRLEVATAKIAEVFWRELNDCDDVSVN